MRLPLIALARTALGLRTSPKPTTPKAPKPAPAPEVPFYYARDGQDFKSRYDFYPEDPALNWKG